MEEVSQQVREWSGVSSIGKSREKPQEKIITDLCAAGWGLGSRKGVGDIRIIELRMLANMCQGNFAQPR